MEQDIRFCKAFDGVRIAYAVTGSGPALVRSLGWFTHLEHEWETPYWRPINEALSSNFTLIRYDGRGMGLSDRRVADFSLAAKVGDLEAVVEAAGLKRFAIWGISEGGPTAVAYAERHPDLVSKLVLYGTTASFGAFVEDERGREFFETMLNLVRLGWGSDQPSFRQFFTGMFVPDATGDAGRLFTDFQRASAPPENVIAMLKALVEYDVREEATRVTVPALVIHRRGDTAIPFEQGREFAALIPGARFLPMDGRNHIPMPEEPEAQALMDALVRFLAEDSAATSSAVPPSGLVTILFTDMAGSTALTQQLGDDRAQDLVRQHNTAVREALRAHAGSEIKHTGDGIMASFASARGAVDCAVAIQRALAVDDLVHVRIGLNAGEPVAEERDLYGTSVQLAARVCAEADAGEILVSNVVRELAAGKGFLFSDRGDHALKGFEDPVKLHEVRWRE